jgi:hypothetical protein
VTLLGQTILRAPDGTRWVVQTLREGGGFLTTARKTGCDLTPAGTSRRPNLAQAKAAHEAHVEAIRTRGEPADPPA